eukprot:13286324-Alexandrium_andersonii.AAC.1
MGPPAARGTRAGGGSRRRSWEQSAQKRRGGDARLGRPREEARGGRAVQHRKGDARGPPPEAAHRTVLTGQSRGRHGGKRGHGGGRWVPQGAQAA